jgi:hypothetical protein
VKKSVSAIWWSWLPGAFLLLQILSEIFLPQPLLSAMHSENGPHELLQFVILLAAFICSVFLLLKSAVQKRWWFSLWCLLAAVGCFYVAGEEISWGQQFFDWATPENWMAKNDQGETNLHNTSSWLDQKPRLILLAGIIIGGLLIPLLKWLRPKLVPSRFDVIYPPPQLALVAALALGIKIAEKTGEQFGLILFERASEVEELFMYYFVYLYVWTLKINNAQK